MSKTLNTRIFLAHDFEINWNKAVNFIPGLGEIIIYDSEVDAEGSPIAEAKDQLGNYPNNRKDPFTTARIKIGDGRRTVVNLEFASSTEGLNSSDEFIFYCGNANELINDI